MSKTKERKPEPLSGAVVKLLQAMVDEDRLLVESRQGFAHVRNVRLRTGTDGVAKGIILDI